MSELKLPHGIYLADAASQENLKKAMAGLRNEFGVRPMVVINGPFQGVGKSRLARLLLYGCGHSKTSTTELPEVDTELWLARQIPDILERGYLFVDDFARKLDSPVLSRLLSSRVWRWRPLRSKTEMTREVDVLVVVTGNNITLSPDLARRSLVINIGASPLQGALQRERELDEDDGLLNDLETEEKLYPMPEEVEEQILLSCSHRIKENTSLMQRILRDRAERLVEGKGKEGSRDE